jgi:glycosyltransferase involved in cell wall biosynthesis
MKILLLGEFSNVHATLAEGLRILGHDVTVISNGDFWKNYPRDIDISRPKGLFSGGRLLLKLLTLLPKMRGYEVVQIISQMFLDLKAEHIAPFYRYLLRHNKKVFLGANGFDDIWIKTCLTDKSLKYSDFNIGEEIRDYQQLRKWKAEWTDTFRERYSQEIARTCTGIIPGLYEYWVGYHKYYPNKTIFIPYPIKMPPSPTTTNIDPSKVIIFIGINRERSVYKGTDIMLRAAQDVLNKYPDKMELRIAESVPFAEYQQMMEGSDAILDQLYAYTPSMNPLLAMSKGIICIGGGEPENYEIINETELRPIINIEPTYDSVYHNLEQLVLNPKRIPELKRQSIEYVKKHHDYLKVAKQYLDFWSK